MASKKAASLITLIGPYRRLSVLLASMIIATFILLSVFSYTAYAWISQQQIITSTPPVSSGDWQNYMTTMQRTPTPTSGCFESNYPSTVWQPVRCISEPNQPMSVGNGVDWSANAGTSTLIGQGTGLFTAVTNFRTETDSQKGGSYYSLQVNSNRYACTYSGTSTTCWEQFIFQNNALLPPQNPFGAAYIEYWLLYWTPPCPSTAPPNSNPWTYYSGPGTPGCYTNTNGASTPGEPPSNLRSYSLAGSAAAFGSNNDQVTFCNSSAGVCYTFSNTKTVLNLYQNWHNTEFNIFGYCCLSQAIFDTGTSLSVRDSLVTGSGAVITPTCLSGGTTGETNNLNLGSCSVDAGSNMNFNESN